MSLTDLLLFTGTVYGTAWILVKSKLVAPHRKKVEKCKFLGPLSQCIVCTSAWVALGLSFVVEYTTVFSAFFRPTTPFDYLVMMAWSVGASWLLGRLLGDAD